MIDTIVDGLRIACAPTPVWFMVAPQESDAEPPPLPLIVVSLGGWDDIARTTCGNSGLWNSTVQVDCFDYTAEGALAQAKLVQAAMPGLSNSVQTFGQFVYEPDARAWRVTLDFGVSDISPLAPSPSP